jgi:xylitol oxidase
MRADGTGGTATLTNWAGNYAYSATRLHEPASMAELQEMIRSAGKLRVLGSRHSFNDIADSPGDLVSLARLPRIVELDAAAGSVTIDGAIRYGDLCQSLDAAGFALHNLASLPQISVAGACATATHGSGDRSGNLATVVTAMEVVTASGEMVVFSRDRNASDLQGAAVALGGLGAVTRLTLSLQPTYRMRQDVFEGLPLSALAEHFDEITSSADSVSLFTEWRGPTIDQVWLKRRVVEGDYEAPADLFGAKPATAQRHPIRSMPPDACTPQLGVAGPWHERLPHFRMDRTPSAGDELQSEYIVPRRHAIDALMAVYRLHKRIAPLVQISEVRTIAAEDLWMSPSYRRESVAIHFTWQPDWTGVREVLPMIEAALRRFEPRPHWAKLFTMAPDELRSRYERMPDFVELLTRMDPAQEFRNAFLDRLLGAE